MTSDAFTGRRTAPVLGCLFWVWSQAPAVAGELSPLALSCQGCHQPAVNSPQMPALDRLPAERIVAALRAARDQPTPGAIMPRFAARLSDEEIDTLAHELSHHVR